MILGAAWQTTILGLPVRFSDPLGLLLAVAACVIALFWAAWIVQRTKLLAKTAPDRLHARMAPAAGSARDWTGLGTGTAGLILLGIAAAQPQCGTRSVLAKRFGMDVVIALDASNSMLARDVKPSRLDRAKLELGSLIDRLKGDRVGLVVFAGDAFVQCPLTNDYAAAKLFLRAINPADLPQQGTAIGAALRVSKELLTGGDRGATGRAVVLLTDGEDQIGGVDEFTKQLTTEGVKVFTVGLGSKTGEPIPVLRPDGSVAGYKKDRSGKTVMTRLAEEPLQQIAEATGGLYVHSASGDLGIGEVYEELERMDKAEFETRLTVQYDHRYEAFAWPGFLLVLFAWAVGEGRFRKRRLE